MLTKGKLFRLFILLSSLFLFVACDEHNIESIKEKCKNYVGIKECECLENELSSKRKEMHYQIQSLLQNNIIICYQKVNKK